MLLDVVCICIYIGDWLLGNGLVGVFSYFFFVLMHALILIRNASLK